MTKLTWQQSQEQLETGYVPSPSPKRKFTIRLEDQLQIDCIKLLRTYQSTHPGKLRWIIAQPERLNRVTPWMRDFLKRLGIFGNQGHPELLLFPAGGDVILIELKTAKGKWSAEQIGWREWCDKSGFKHYAITTTDELDDVLRLMK